MSRYPLRARRIVILLATVAATGAVASLLAPAVRAAAGDWATYLSGTSRSGFNGAETTITPSAAPHLKLHWRAQAGGAISTQPIVANNLVYWGSGDGYEHATNPSGTEAWKAFVGTSTNTCANTTSGVASTATAVSVNGTPLLVVGGGDKQLYALNATTGAVVWHTPLGYYIWSSPAVYGGSVYIGLAALGDCPTIRGELVQVALATGSIQNIFYTVPAGCKGGSVWGSPTIDEAAGTVYFVTGEINTCSTSEPYAEAIIELSAANLAYIASWQVPASARVKDGDFGSTPTLFTATIGGAQRAMVGAANKNGRYYAFDRTALSNGPLWSVRLAVGGPGPEKGQGSIAPSAWDGTRLYAAGGNTTINGHSCKGSIRALNPATGAFIWQHCLSAPVLAAVSAVPGVATAGNGTALTLVATATGKTLFAYHDTSAGSLFWGAASISNGVLYQGNMDGTLVALGL